MEDDFKLPTIEVEKFKKAQESYKKKVELLIASPETSVTTLDKYETSIDFMKSAGGLKHAEIDFDNSAHHRLLAHGLLLQENSISEWKKYEFTKQFSDQDFRFALSALGEHHRWQQEGTGEPNFIGNDDINRLGVLLGIASGQVVRTIAVSLKMIGMSKDAFDRSDIEAIQAIKPHLFENDSFREDFLKVFKVDQNAQSFFIQKNTEISRRFAQDTKTLNQKLSDLEKKLLKSKEISKNTFKNITVPKHQTHINLTFEQRRSMNELGTFLTDSGKLTREISTTLNLMGIKSKFPTTLLEFGSGLTKVGTELQALSSIGNLVSVAGFASGLGLFNGVFALGSAIFGRKKKRKGDNGLGAFLQAIGQQLQAISQQLDAISQQLDAIADAIEKMHKEMRMSFEKVFENQKLIYEAILDTRQIVSMIYSDLHSQNSIMFEVLDQKFTAILQGDLNTAIDAINNHMQGIGLSLSNQQLKQHTTTLENWLTKKALDPIFSGENLPASATFDWINKKTKHVSPNNLAFSLGYVKALLEKLSSENIENNSDSLFNIDIWRSALSHYIKLIKKLGYHQDQGIINLLNEARDKTINAMQFIKQIRESTEIYEHLLYKYQQALHEVDIIVRTNLVAIKHEIDDYDGMTIAEAFEQSTKTNKSDWTNKLNELEYYYQQFLVFGYLVGFSADYFNHIERLKNADDVKSLPVQSYLTYIKEADQILLEAAYSLDIEKARFAMQFGANPNAQGNNGAPGCPDVPLQASVLHQAIYPYLVSEKNNTPKNKIDLLSLLIQQKNTDLNSRNTSPWCGGQNVVLNKMVWSSNPELVLLFLARGADPTLNDSYYHQHMNPYQDANCRINPANRSICYTDQSNVLTRDVFDYVLDIYKNLSTTQERSNRLSQLRGTFTAAQIKIAQQDWGNVLQFYYASISGKDSVATSILNRVTQTAEQSNVFAQSLLWMVAILGNWNLLDKVDISKINFNEKMGSYITPLILASKLDRADVVEGLLNKNVNTDVLYYGGKNAFELACEHLSLEAAEVFLQKQLIPEDKLAKIISNIPQTKQSALKKLFGKYFVKYQSDSIANERTSEITSTTNPAIRYHNLTNPLTYELDTLAFIESVKNNESFNSLPEKKLKQVIEIIDQFLGAKTGLNNHHRLITERTEQPTDDSVEVYQTGDETDDEETILILSTFDMLSNKKEENPDQTSDIICIDDECLRSPERSFEVQNNAGLRYSSETENYSLQTSNSHQLKPGLLSTLSTAAYSFFQWIPRFELSFVQPIHHQEHQSHTQPKELNDAHTDHLHIAVALSAAEQSHTPVYETYKALEQHGFEAQCDETLTTCTVSLTEQSIDAVNQIAAEQKHIDELAARTNPNAPAMFDAIATFGMFAIAKTYQWYRGEPSQETESADSILKNKAEERLLSRDEINSVKPELLQQTQSLMQRSITLAQHENFVQLDTNQQIVFFEETNEAFDVLKKQLNAFQYNSATVGDLFDIRYHLRDISGYLDEIETECVQLNTVGAGLGLQ